MPEIPTPPPTGVPPTTPGDPLDGVPTSSGGSNQIVDDDQREPGGDDDDGLGFLSLFFGVPLWILLMFGGVAGLIFLWIFFFSGGGDEEQATTTSAAVEQVVDATGSGDDVDAENGETPEIDQAADEDATTDSVPQADEADDPEVDADVEDGDLNDGETRPESDLTKPAVPVLIGTEVATFTELPFRQYAGGPTPIEDDLALWIKSVAIGRESASTVTPEWIAEQLPGAELFGTPDSTKTGDYVFYNLELGGDMTPGRSYQSALLTADSNEINRDEEWESLLQWLDQSSVTRALYLDHDSGSFTALNPSDGFAARNTSSFVAVSGRTVVIGVPEDELAAYAFPSIFVRETAAGLQATEDDPAGYAFFANTYFPTRLHPDLVALIGGGDCSTVQPESDRLCLGDRFEIAATQTMADGEVIIGGGQVEGNSALFWFSDPTKTDLLVNVLNGCETYGSFWIFAAGSTGGGFSVTVTDTQTGTTQTYENSIGQLAAPIQDTQAFATCP